MEKLRPKLFSSMKNYTKGQLIKDIVAGIIVAIIAFPLSVALAISSGMSPQCGLYTAIIGGFFVSALGGSRVNIGGATAATVMTVFTIIDEFGLVGLAIATIMAGIILVIMGLCRAGILLKYIPRTITLGFTAAIGMGIFSSQLKGFFGFTMDSIPVNTIDKFVAYAKVIDTLDMTTLGIGLLAMVVLVVMPKISSKIPGSLIAILVTTPIVSLFNLNVPTIRSVYGELPSHFPTIEIPDITWKLITDLLPSAITLAILIAIVSLLSCVVTDGLMGEPHNSNMELIAEGIANIFCGLFGAVPVAGAVARSSTSVKNGGRTPIAGIVHSIIVTLILLFMLPLAGYIPMPTLAAVLILVAYNMCNFKEIISLIKRAPKSDIFVLVLTFVLGVVVNLLFAVEIGVLSASLLFMKRMSEQTDVQGWHYREEACVDNPDELLNVPKAVRVYEITGPLFFGVAESLTHIHLKEYTECLVIRMRSVTSIDITSLIALEKVCDICAEKGISVVLSHVNEQPMKMMKKAGFVKKIGEDHFAPNIDAALALAGEIVSKQEKEMVG